MAKYRLDPKNARTHPERNKDAIGKSLRELGAGRSIVVDRDGVVIGGNAVYEKAVELGLGTEVVHTSGDKLVVVVRDDLATDDPRRKALALADNQIALLAEWDEVKLEEILGELGDIDLDVMGFEKPDNGSEGPPSDHKTLTEQFLVPPFSVLDARQGYWQERKRAWLALGIQSELGRGGSLTVGIDADGVDTRGSGKAYTERGKRQ